MARIPVEQERHGGSGWWKWLLGLVAVGLLIWLVASLVDTGSEQDMTALDDPNQSEAVEGETPTAMSQDPQAMQGEDTPVTTIAQLENGTSAQQTAGQEAQLTDVRIAEVVNDSTFYVEPADAGAEAQTTTQQGAQQQADGQSSPALGTQEPATGEQTTQQQGDMRSLVLVDDMTEAQSGDGNVRDQIEEDQRIRMLEGSVQQLTDGVTSERGVDQASLDGDDYYVRAERLDIAEASR